MTQYFSIKEVQEKVILTFDFSSDLSGAETLSGVPAVTITSVFAADPSPTAVLNGAASYDSTNKMVYQPVQGGVNGTSYLFDVVAPTTNVSKVYERSAILTVLSEY